ncbi:MAG: hypothetical protein EBU90_07360 [Proteobacteria bacterium]|nr:hypothetical protein [Pseudomonadota bacterium]NBP13479.1 hypothetical protein [bacterium]
MIQKPQFTVNDETHQIWPLDEYSRTEILRTFGSNQIGFDYIPTTMGMPALKFRSIQEYKQALRLMERF